MVPDATREWPESAPQGTITFLFTDIEGSTQRWEAGAGEMTKALALHDEVLRGAVERHGGWLFKHTGDGICAAFRSARHAVDAATEAQRALELPVRMGIGSGEAELRDNDYFGPALNRAARVMAAGHGGQILLAASTASLLEDSGLIDLGEYRLRDLAGSQRLFQVQAPGLAQQFPPLRTLDAVPGNLPTQVTSFVGRAAEITAITGELRAKRLVTLTGVGGVGKTRLGLHVAAEMLPEFPDGAWFVELAPLDTEDALVDAVAAVLSVSPRPERTMRDCLVNALRERRLLLVLDNCEHLVDEVARLVETILGSCPAVTMLATSREGLGVNGEHVWPVPSLGVRDPSSGVELFVDRARAVEPSFELGSDADVVADLCRRLDGIPLAIELAAARMRSMSPSQVRDRLDERFKLLTGARRSLERHQTLRHAMQWSYDLLSDDERRVLNRASVFAGDFSLEAAQRVCGAGDTDEFQTIDVLDSLVRKSLVHVKRSGDVTRYGLLETIRQFGDEQLGATDDLGAARDRHAAFFAGSADANFNLLRSPDALLAHQWVEREMANLRAAFRWATTRASADVAIRIAAGAHEIARFSCRYDTLGWAAEVADVARRLEHRRLPLLLTMACDSSWTLGRLEEARSFGSEALSLLGDTRFDPFIWAYTDLAMITAFEGNIDGAIELLRAGSENPEDAHDRFCASVFLYFLALSRKQEALAIADRVIAAAEATGVPVSIAIALNSKAIACADVDPVLSLETHERALRVAHGCGNRFFENSIRLDMAALQARSGTPALALTTFAELLDGWQLAGDQFLGIGMGHLVVLFDRLGRYEAAATLYGALTRDVSLDGLVAGLPSVVEHLTQTLGAETFAEFRSRGAAMTLRDAGANARGEIADALAAIERSAS